MLRGRTCVSIFSPLSFGAISGPPHGPEMAPKMPGDKIDLQSYCQHLSYSQHIIAHPWAETIRIGAGKWSDMQVKKAVSPDPMNFL